MKYFAFLCFPSLYFSSEPPHPLETFHPFDVCGIFLLRLTFRFNLFQSSSNPKKSKEFASSSENKNLERQRKFRVKVQKSCKLAPPKLHETSGLVPAIPGAVPVAPNGHDVAVSEKVRYFPLCATEKKKNQRSSSSFNSLVPTLLPPAPTNRATPGRWHFYALRSIICFCYFPFAHHRGKTF